jgi:hypothetical protein
MQAAYGTYDPDPIVVPALSMYAVPKSQENLMRPWYDASDPKVREGVPTLFRLARERYERHAKWFAGFAKGGRVVEISGAHHLFFTNAREVVEQIDAFMSALQGAR